MKYKNVIKDLQEIVEGNIDLTLIPYKKGNSIRIGKIVIRENKSGYLIFNIEENKQVAKTFCKTAAIAVAKSLNKNHQVGTIFELDKIIEKHYTDCVFYRHTMENTKDDFKREISQVRYDIAKSRTTEAKRSLDYLIFS